MPQTAASLFDELPEQAVPARDPGAARITRAYRGDVRFEQFVFDDLIAQDHQARSIWLWLEREDFSELEEEVKARDHEPGRPASDPRVLLALWMYGHVTGVASARHLERPSENENAFRWLRGGVPLNHRMLSEARWAGAGLLDRMLKRTVAAMRAAGLLDMTTVAQDGIRVRASAGESSYRRVGSLAELLKQARERQAFLDAEAVTNPGAQEARVRGARERAARELVERTEAAHARATAMAAAQAEEEARQAAIKRRVSKDKDGKPKAPKVARKKEPRVSTTDAEARVMRMADGGYRPAWNVQVTSDVGSGMVLAVSIDATGSDGGLMGPAAGVIEERYGETPERWLADGGYTKLDDIEALSAMGIEVFCPAKPPRNPKNDPAVRRPGDTPAIAAWRVRMARQRGESEIDWMRRRAECERIHANFRKQGLRQCNVRGRYKVGVVALMHALANNIVTAIRLLALQAA